MILGTPLQKGMLRICPGMLNGALVAPASKSHTLRAVFFAAIAKGRSEIRNFLHSPDSSAMIQAMREFGACIETTEDCLQIHGLNHTFGAAQNVIDAGNSGLVLRFVGALASLSPAYTVITGDHSIRNRRPMGPLLNALSHLGAFATSSRLNGYAPIIIKGPIHPGHAHLSGEDSQPISALLIAASLLSGKTTLEVHSPGEKPWIDMTLHWLKKFGVEITHTDYERYTIPGNAFFESFSVAIPGDFSSAAFPIAAALITHSEITLSNLDMEDSQGDKGFIDVLQKMGAKIDIDKEGKKVRIHKESHLQGGSFDMNDFIDAIPILAVIACYAEGITKITNASIARKKESDRLDAITTELKKMGALIEETQDGLIISPSPLHGAHLSSWNDHRIAMSLAIGALGAKGDTLIDNIECIAKTYPTFVRDFQSIGALMEVMK